VERLFSIFKHALSDRRQSFKIENLEKHLIINFLIAVNKHFVAYLSP
jgi:hypothetical protein